MNYYEHHLGDYDGATAHLSWLEDCAYRRMICLYYRNEGPLPADIKRVCRLVRAASKQERDAVQQVLSEFFQLADDGWHHKRCDAEVARYTAKSQKARESVSKRWANREANAQRKDIERDTNVSTNVDTNVLPTHCEGNTPRARPQTPDTRHQEESPIPPSGAGKPEPPEPPTGKAKAAAVSLKAWIDAERASGRKPIPPDDPVFAYAAETGIPPEFLGLAWAEFRARYLAPDAKRYRDWRAVFRRAVRGNWLRLWFLDPASQQYGLTTVGMQAKRSAERAPERAA